MKKLYLILIITLLCGAKGYCQLLNSNNSGTNTEPRSPIPFLQNIYTTSDNVRLNYLETESLIKQFNDQKAAIDKFNKALIANRQKIAAKGKVHYDNDLDLATQALEAQLKVARSDKIKLYKRIIDLTKINYETYFKTLDAELVQYTEEIEKINKLSADYQTDITDESLRWFVKDGFDKESKQIKTALDKLKKERDKLYNDLNNVKPSDRLINDGDSDDVKETLYQNALSIIEQLNKDKEKFIEQSKQFAEDYKSFKEEANKKIEILNKKRAEAEEKIGDQEKLSAIGGITTVLGENSFVVPNISVVGQKKFVSKEHSSIYGEVKLIVGANDSDKKNTGVSKMFIPEASTFGFMTDFSFGFNPSDRTPSFNSKTKRYDQRLAINVGAYYLGKKLQPDTTTSFNSSLFHLKLGIEYAIMPEVLSVYFNTNHLLVTTNIANFEKYYSDANRVRSYTSFGIQSLLDLTEKKDFFLHVNLGFVRVNNDVNTWLKTSDSVIPNVKLTLIKKL